MWNSAPRRTEAQINGIVDQLFCTRFLDLGLCGGCQKEGMGVYGPEGHDVFYCRKCWVVHMKATKDDEWQEWCQWAPAPRKCPTESARHHELKCALLALSRIEGASLTFPASLSSYDRLKVHEFCAGESELQNLSTKSYGEDTRRFLRVTSGSATDGIAEARALVAHELGGDGDVAGVADAMQQLSLKEGAPAAHGEGQDETAQPQDQQQQGQHQVETQAAAQPAAKPVAKSAAKTAAKPAAKPAPPAEEKEAPPPPPPTKAAPSPAPPVAAAAPAAAAAGQDEAAFPSLGASSAGFPALGAAPGGAKKAPRAKAKAGKK